MFESGLEGGMVEAIGLDNRPRLWSVALEDGGVCSMWLGGGV